MKKDILDLVPKHAEKRLGGKKEAYAGYTPLDVPNWIDSGIAVRGGPGSGVQASCMVLVGKFLDLIMQKYVFSPLYLSFRPSHSFIHNSTLVMINRC